MSELIFTKRLQLILVVGGILLALVILFSVVMPSPFIGPRSNPNTSSAENSAQNLKIAISAYRAEYRKFPIKVSDQTNDVLAQTDHALMDVLLAADKEAAAGGLNARRISFFSGHAAKKATAGKYRKGVKLESGGAGELWDPYSNYYQVLMDANSDNSIDSPETKGISIEASIIVWSAGPDGDFDTWEDNIKTW